MKTLSEMLLSSHLSSSAIVIVVVQAEENLSIRRNKGNVNYE